MYATAPPHSTISRTNAKASQLGAVVEGKGGSEPDSHQADRSMMFGQLLGGNRANQQVGGRHRNKQTPPSTHSCTRTHTQNIAKPNQNRIEPNRNRIEPKRTWRNDVLLEMNIWFCMVLHVFYVMLYVFEWFLMIFISFYMVLYGF